MIFPSEFFDPTGNGFDVGDLGILVSVVVAITAVVMGVAKWMSKQVREVVRDEIEQATRLIQPTSNGGKSLPDIADRLSEIEQIVMVLARKSGAA